MTPSFAGRRRLVEAMGLGPLWVRRAPPVPARGDGPIDDASIDVRAQRIGRLDREALGDDVAACVACDLSRSRTQAVSGFGVPRPDWLVVGSAPGPDEDVQGDAFVGQGGKLLDAMLASLGLSRERDVFVTHVVKCRPPGDRAPSADEAACCRPYLERQIALLAPRLILVVGEAAARLLLSTDEPFDRVRGRRHALTLGGREIAVVATYDPAHLVRSGDDKAKAWADLCFAREVFGSMETTSS